MGAVISARWRMGVISISIAVMKATNSPIVVAPSVPAVTPWSVAVTNRGKLAKCTARQARLDRCLRSSEVASTAISR